MGANAGAVWAAASTGFSAFLYLLDFGTTISTLRTYYFYEYQCPHAPLPSSVLRGDPLCRAIRAGITLFFPFWTCLGSVILAHLTYAFVFWLSLEPRHHPLRLAYFLPLVHLYRLLKLFSHTFSCKDLKELTKSQRECTSLFSAIGASVETIPQFCIQFILAMKLGEHVKGSSYPNLQAQKIPTNLIVSLVASMLSGSYNMSMAVWSLMEEQVSLASKAFYCFLIGCQTLAGMLARALCISALSEFSKTVFSISLLIYMTSGVITTWLFIYLLLQSHQYNGKGKSKYLRVAHSFGLALMTRASGPIYVTLKFKGNPCLLMWGMLSHIFVELIGVAFVFLLPYYIKDQQSPCHSFHIGSMELVEENKYLTCKVFLGTLLSTLVIFILTTLQLFCLEIKKNARVVPCTFSENACDTHTKPTFSKILTINGSRGSKDKHTHQMSAIHFFTLFLFVFSFIFTQKLQMKYVPKRPPHTL